MALLEIKIYGDPILRKKALAVEHPDDSVRRLIGNMAETMYQREGVGLAAPQVGTARRIIVMDAGRGLLSLINPEIVYRRGRERREEGCLSLPEIIVPVSRAEAVRVKGLNADGKEVFLDAEGLLARVIQHEIDHLRGTLIVDRASLFRKVGLAGKLKNLRRSAG